MPDNHIVVRPGAVDLRISGQRIQDFPNTGTYISTEKFSPVSVHQEGQSGSAVSVRMSGKSYRVTTTILQGGPDDVYFQRAINFLANTDAILSLTLNFLGKKYVSGFTDGETEPTRDLAGDSSPNVVYTWVGSFQIVTPGTFTAPPVATSAQINSFGQ